MGIRLAEKNLIRVTEENTARDAAHFLSMLGGQQPSGHSARTESVPSMGGAVQVASDTTGAPMAMGTGQGMEHGLSTEPLTLDFLAGPRGLSADFSGLVQGLNIFKFNLFDLEGNAVWSTDPAFIGATKRESPL